MNGSVVVYFLFVGWSIVGYVYAHFLLCISPWAVFDFLPILLLRVYKFIDIEYF